MIFNRRPLLFLILLVGFFQAEAKCKISKRYIDNYEPKRFHLDNNLLSSYSSLPDNNVLPIIIKGRVLDEDCQPLTNVFVHAWQVGVDGKYPYVPLRTVASKSLINLKSRSKFIGSGTATTNNFGEFAFVTMHPVSQKMNYINMRVEIDDTRYLQTKMYIDYVPATVLYNKKLDFQENKYYFDIVVPKS